MRHQILLKKRTLTDLPSQVLRHSNESRNTQQQILAN